MVTGYNQHELEFMWIVEITNVSFSILFSFLKKFKPRIHNSKSDRASPVEIISPNHPQRFTKREVR